MTFDTLNDDDPANSADNPAGSQNPDDLWAPLFKQVAELREYASYYVAARADLIRLKLRRLLIVIAMGVVALVCGVSLAIGAIVYLLQGLAGGLGEWLGRPWAGQLVAGCSLLLLFAFGGYLAVSLSERRKRRQIGTYYEHRREQQSAAFGQNVRARSEASHQRASRN